MTNRQCCSLTHTRAIHFAKHYGRVVFRWMKEYRCWKQQPPVEFEAEAIDDPVFYEYYVTGANGFFTEAYQCELLLVNALSIQYHSIKFDDDVEKWLEEFLQHAKPGDVITVSHHLLFINVEVCMPENTLLLS